MNSPTRYHNLATPSPSSIVPEKLEADPTHVERRAGRVDGERHEIAVMGVFPYRVQKRVVHWRHELGKHDCIPV